MCIRDRLYGTVLSVPIILVSLIYGKYLGRKICQIPDGEGWTREYEPGQAQAELEAAAADSDALSISPLMAFSPILFPILFILLKTGLKSVSYTHLIIPINGKLQFRIQVFNYMICNFIEVMLV